MPGPRGAPLKEYGDVFLQGISVPNVCSEHLFRTSVFPMCLALVEVFGDFRRQIRIQHVELL